MRFSYFHWFWCSSDNFHSNGYVFLNLIFKSESLVREVLLEVLKAIQAFLIQTFCWDQWEQAHCSTLKISAQKVLINFWANNVSTGNSGKGHPPVSIVIHFVRRRSSVLLFRIFLFALIAHRKSRSQPWGFFFWNTMFNWRLEVVPASAVFILFV